jgi:ABC-type glycerol-3-phosphate transport system substrate-binding protein
MRKSLVAAALIVIVFMLLGCGMAASSRASVTASPSGDTAIAQAFKDRISGVQVSGQGIVARVLPDDNEGARHQRFILRLASGQTLLFAHNIDIAPRLASLKPGDLVAFSGIYEWNSQGGLVHWTHHDPSGQHPTGWLKLNGSLSQ